MAGTSEPNLYELQGDKVKVVYSTSSTSGQPLFQLQLGRKTLQFTGRDIKTGKTLIGTLITVTVEAVPDLRTVTFSVLLPDVNLLQSKRATVRTIGILTTSKTSIGGPNSVKGAVQTYKVAALIGVARAVVF